MRSCLYRGTTWHRRDEPRYEFEYSVWYAGIDLAEIDAIDSKLPLFSHNRGNLTSLWDRDYDVLTEGIESYAPGVEAASVQLVTMPRFAGFVFNPVSFFLFRDGDGALVHALAEVHNTWGERHVYVLPAHPVPAGNLASGQPGKEPEARGSRLESTASKVFYVSPFMDIEGGYEVRLQEDAGGHLTIALSESDADGRRFFEAGISVDPLSLTQRNILWMLLRFPFVNLKTVAAIHWQGLKLWWRGERFRPNPSRTKRREREVTP